MKVSKFFDQKNDHWRHVAYLDIKSGALINFFTVLEVNRAVLNYQKISFWEFPPPPPNSNPEEIKMGNGPIKSVYSWEYATRLQRFKLILLRVTDPRKCWNGLITSMRKPCYWIIYCFTHVQFWKCPEITQPISHCRSRMFNAWRPNVSRIIFLSRSYFQE